MIVGIIGNGVVGQAVGQSYALQHEVRGYDINPARSRNPLPEVLDADVVFVCLPTPGKKCESGLDLSAIHGFFDTVKDSKYRASNFVLKSTVPIGTTRLLRRMYSLSNIVHSPEFLTARTAAQDAANPRVNIVGTDMNRSTLETCTDVLTKLYQQQFPSVPVMQVASDESEAIKLFLNGYFAVKVAYFNEVRSLADKLKLTWSLILVGMLSDGRIYPEHTQVPGPDGQRGFGGSCLPKDLEQLVEHFDVFGDRCPTLVTDAALVRNSHDRKEQQS